MVHRDHQGTFIARSCPFLSSITEPEQAELLACRCAVTLAIGMGVLKLMLESDCVGVVSKLKAGERGLSDLLLVPLLKK